MAHDRNQDFTRLIDNAKLFPNYQETVCFVNTWKDDQDKQSCPNCKLKVSETKTRICFIQFSAVGCYCMHSIF